MSSITPATPIVGTPHTGFKLGYRPALDGLRGISILLILEHHSPSHVNRLWFLPGGFIGVDIFFVLSGFLITTLLVQEWEQSHAISLKNFYLRRVLRLFPALFLLITLTALYALLAAPPDRKAGILFSIVPALFYATNWVIAFNPDYQITPLGITWSLAIEEQFYIFWPLLLSLALRLNLGRRRTILFLALAVAGVSLLRIWMTLEGVSARRMYYGTDTRADSLLAGCLLSLLLLWGWLPFRPWGARVVKALAALAVLTLAAILIMMEHTGPLLYLAGFTTISVSVALIILMLFYAPLRPALAILNYGPLVWVGKISYGLYLLHWPVRSLMIRLLPDLNIFSDLAYLCLTFIAAALSFYLLERPFLRLKKRFRAEPLRARLVKAV
ncbi:MAG TPA: acyltransferase [Pyrinomonadaceae bacterium]|nr:acyltransferase [Pyrinomonadaceae bacterium]